MGALPPVGTFVTGYRIFPFVGLIEPGQTWRPQATEVEQVLEFRLADLMAGHEMQRLIRKGVPIKTPTYTVDDHLVWGATARIVQSLLRPARRRCLDRRDVDVLLDGDGDHVAPLGPRAVVVLDVVVAEQLVQHEPGVRRALADPAVGDDRGYRRRRPCRCRARAARRPT